MNITVNDGYHSNYTEVKIRVKDINDNAPEFSQTEYVVTSVVEEQQPPTGGLILVQVRYKPHDWATTSQVKYKHMCTGKI